MPLADRYDGFLIDLDGVVLLGNELIPGADRAIAELTGSGRPVAVVTNSPRLTPAQRAEQLERFGISLAPENIITAGAVLIELARQHLGQPGPVLATGTGNFLDQVDAAGLERVDTGRWQQARAVLVTGHDRFGYDEMRAASMAARAGAVLLASAADPTMPMPDGLWPGTGAVLAAIETASGRRAEIAGKPAAPIFRAGLDALGLEPGSKVAMVGDRLDSDIAGAQRAGIDGILVAGNDSSPSPGDRAPEPQHRIGTLAELAG